MKPISTITIMILFGISACTQTIDYSFNLKLLKAGESAAIRSLPDNEILIMGNSIKRMNDRILSIGLSKLLSDGQTDETFRTNILGEIRILETDSQGMIYLIGQFRSENTDEQLPTLIRLLPEGHLDTSFKYTLDHLGEIQHISINTGDEILLDIKDTNKNINNIIKLDYQGNKDDSFNDIQLDKPKVSQIIYAQDIVLVLGYSLEINEATYRLLKFDNKGNLDSIFTEQFNGCVINDEQHISQGIISNNRYLFATRANITAVDSSGNCHISAPWPNNSIYNWAMTSEDHIILCTTGGDYYNLYTNFTNFIDTEYLPFVSLYGERTFDIDSETKIISNCNLKSSDFIDNLGLCRYNSDMVSFDTIFFCQAYELGDIHDAHIQETNAYIAVGDFILANESETTHIAKFNNIGNSDQLFNSNFTHKSRYLQSIDAFDNGRLLIGGKKQHEPDILPADTFLQGLYLLNENGELINNHDINSSLFFNEDLGFITQATVLPNQDFIVNGAGYLRIVGPQDSIVEGGQEMQIFDSSGKQIIDLKEEKGIRCITSTSNNNTLIDNSDNIIFSGWKVSYNSILQGHALKINMDYEHVKEFAPSYESSSIFTASIFWNGQLIVANHHRSADSIYLQCFDSFGEPCEGFNSPEFATQLDLAHRVLGIAAIGNGKLLIYGRLGNFQGKNLFNNFVIDSTGNFIGTLAAVENDGITHALADQDTVYLFGKFSLPNNDFTSVLKIVNDGHVTSNEDIYFSKNISVFPNIINSPFINIRLEDNSENKETNISIVNSSGHEVYQTRKILQEGINSIDDLPNLIPGLYFFKLTNYLGRVFIGKIVVQ